MSTFTKASVDSLLVLFLEALSDTLSSVIDKDFITPGLQRDLEEDTLMLCHSAQKISGNTKESLLIMNSTNGDEVAYKSVCFI